MLDPKHLDFDIYRGATLLTPNRKEFAEATRTRITEDVDVAAAARPAIEAAECEGFLVTQSEHGMTLVPRTGAAIHVPAHPVKVRDVSGAGDTVAAVVAVVRAAGADWETTVRAANAAGSLSDTAIALNATGVLALPYIVLRNDQQDAIGAGLAVTEYALHGKSADEIRGLWRWVAGRLTADDTPADRFAIAAANEQTDLRAAG